ncbi:purine-nucleoside phosphorylase [Candidatus Dependentiae bacterium]|nr:purine-nucleoside phosphorylase [Candidatus Dependentiae bacterium]
MSIHIGAKENEIAETVLMSGDPLRAKHIAENLLEKSVCYNQVRGMYGYTGYYKGKRVSVQGSGMGAPSIAIYANELVKEYKVKQIIRIGTCGSIQPEIKIKDVVLAMSASADFTLNDMRFNGMTYAPCADFGLLYKAYNSSVEKKIHTHIGNVLNTNDFYYDGGDIYWKRWAEYGVLAIDMESFALYTIASKNHVKALTLLTVSDSFITHEKASAEERQLAFIKMVDIALDII